MDCKNAQSMITAYIQRNLAEDQVEEFIDHIGECKECHEELEIYFTIHFALQRLDENTNTSYNIQQMLKEDLAFSERNAHRRKFVRVFSYGLMVIAEIVLAIVLFMQVQIWSSGSVEDTAIFKLMYGEVVESQMMTEVVSEIEHETMIETESKKDEREASIN